MLMAYILPINIRSWHDIVKTELTVLKNAAQNARSVRGIFAKQDNERRIKRVLKVDYI
jgi:hypothetical protein